MSVKTYKQLKNKYWPTVRKYILNRDKHTCQLCGNRSRLQVDHCFSRAIQLLHFDDRNLTTLCSTCHTKKSYAKQDYIDRVKDVVIKREGQYEYEDLRKTSKRVGKVTEEDVINLINEYKARWPEVVYGQRNV